jgi:hypothetical protein
MQRWGKFFDGKGVRAKWNKKVPTSIRRRDTGMAAMPDFCN